MTHAYSLYNDQLSSSTRDQHLAELTPLPAAWPRGAVPELEKKPTGQEAGRLPGAHRWATGGGP